MTRDFEALGYIAVLGIMVIIGIGMANARDLDGRYANAPHKAWVESLKNGQGVSCCDNSDGFKVEDPDWRNVGDTFEVKIDGNWKQLEEHQIITEPNRIGYAMVWIWRGSITCFMPGARG